MDFKDENLNLELLNRFKTFVRKKNHENDELKDEDEEFRFKNDREEFKHEYKYNPIRSLQSEYWEYSFGDPNDKQYYPHQYVNLRLTHEGLSYEDIKEKIKSKEPYNLLASIGGYYTVVGHGYSTYLNFVEYNDIFLGLIDKHQSLGSMILDFLCNYLDYSQFSPNDYAKNRLYEKYCRNYRFYIRDIDLPREMEEKYEIGRIMHDNRELTLGDIITKGQKSHRFLIVSSHMSEYYSEFDFSTFRISHGHLKVIDKISHNGVCQITLLELPTDIWPIFESEDFDLKDMIEESRKIFFESFDTKINIGLESGNHENLPLFSLGLDENGDYIKPFHTIHNSNGTSSESPVLDLKSKFIATRQLLCYNYPSLKDNIFPAPRWLVFPELSCGSLGWRMGYGEEYIENFIKIRIDRDQFDKLFPKPLNWSLKYSKPFHEYMENKFSYEYSTPYFTIGWNERGSPKYSFENLKNRLKDKNSDTLNKLYEAGEVIFIDEFFDDELLYASFRIDANNFDDIHNAILFASKDFWQDEMDEDLKEKIWDEVKYPLVLNLLYFRLMSDESMIKNLMDTEDKIILAENYPIENDSDYWCVNLAENELIGENHLGFALMELRDEINRIYKNNDKIDWFYTEFLNNVSYYDFKPYEHKYRNEMEDDFYNKQSPEYIIYKATYDKCGLYFHDLNLSRDLEEKYNVGELIQERGFIDMTDKIGQMTTSHRYAILSNHVKDFSEFESGTKWGLHTAKRNSIFKILDIYKFRGKTQILLLHLLDGFDEIFIDNNTIDMDKVESAREIFEDSFEKDMIEEINSPEWLNLCNHPLGFDDEGRLWEIKKD